MKRRELLTASALALSALPALGRAAAPAPRARFEPKRFDYAALKGHARALAAQDYVAPELSLPTELAQLDWDHYQAIRPLPEHALWADLPSRFRVQFFHLGRNYRRPVHIYELVDGVAREIGYDPRRFDLTGSGVHGAALPHDLGYAGFRLSFDTDFTRDVVAFLGASYFRAVGGTMQYGLSARGLAIDCGLPRAEEFPDFTTFWLERPRAGAAALTLYALLDSPSATGAYRFEIAPGEPLVMRVDAALYPRKAIERLGVAPLTSMFLVGPNDRRVDDDWRRVIHDSDGLSIWTGAGEWIWRPLTNPAAVRVNSFLDQDPHGFGLLQRDREFDHYQDDGVFYDRRPSLWVEPLSAFGKGAVQLVEIPAPDETYDNIVAFWNPAAPPRPGQELLYAYRLYWGSAMPASPPLARAVATRTGIGGVVGLPRDHFSWRFVVDFAGGPLDALPRDAAVEPVISLSRGRTEIVSARPLDSVHGWRAMFDLVPDASPEPVDLRLFLRSGGRALSETWIYQWTPPPNRRTP
ncbi:MAG TPA: glucan biosynthesis protein D [Dokdonella sp.]